MKASAYIPINYDSPAPRNARIAVLGPNITLHNPVLVAEQIAFLDHLTHGRLIVALLRGTPTEMLPYSTNAAESRALYQEGIELIMQALTEPEPFGWQGRYFEFRTVSIWPRCLQQPHPPLYASGSFDSLEFTATQRLKAAVSFTPVDAVTEEVRRYRPAARAAGWAPTRDDFLFRGHIHVAETDEAARAAVAEALGRVSNPYPASVIAAVLASHNAGSARPTFTPPSAPGGPIGGFPGAPHFCGSPATVLEQIRRYHEAGVGTIDFGFRVRGMWHEESRRSLELFAREVLPAVHKLDASGGVDRPVVAAADR